MIVWVCYWQFCEDTVVEGVATTEAIAKEWLAARQAKKHKFYEYSYAEIEVDTFSDQSIP